MSTDPADPADPVLWRVRVTMPDRPGALAALAREVAATGANIVGVQVFLGIDSVTDELILRTPPQWSSTEIAELVTGAGGRGAVATPCTDAALVDQPTRYVQACRAVLAQPASFPDVVAQLFDADTVPDAARDPAADEHLDVMEMVVGQVQVQVRREAPFTDVERARGAAMAGLVSEVLGRERPTFESSGSRRIGSGATPEYVVSGSTVTALADGTSIGWASTTPDPAEPGVHRIDLEVDPVWQRRGVGTRLLGDGARLARMLGAREVLLSTSHDNRAAMPMVLAAGMRGRIRMAGETLTVRIAVHELRPLVPGEQSA